MRFYFAKISNSGMLFAIADLAFFDLIERLRAGNVCMAKLRDDKGIVVVMVKQGGSICLTYDLCAGASYLSQVFHSFKFAKSVVLRQISDGRITMTVK